MQLMGRDFKTTLISTGAIAVVVTFLAGASLTMFVNNLQVQHKLELFTELVTKEEYAEARRVYEDFLNTPDQDKVVSSIRAALALQMADLTRQILESGAVPAAKIQGLTLFQNELADLLDQEVDRVIAMYLQQQIDYSTVESFLAAMRELGQNSTTLGKYEYLARAEMLQRRYDYEGAAQFLAEALQIYPGEQLLTAKLAECRQQQQQLVVYDGPIPHLFFHPLIAYPELAFDGDRMAQGYDDYFVTVSEFNKILASLYKNNYLLVDMDSIFATREENGSRVLQRKELRLPPGKIPLLISIDDLNYYQYMLKNGNVHKLVLDDKGNIATLSVSPQGEQIIASDNEIVPILDRFVDSHPDFSWQGAKGIIALTGYEGILGYRTDADSPTREEEKRAVLPVVKRLKETGWSFASHGYGHLDAAKVGYSRFVQDTRRWKNEVEPLIGPTNVYIYPYGSKVLPKDAKFRYLLEAGFNVLCAVGPAEYLQSTPQYAMMDRRHIDGIALRHQRSRLLDFFDADEVIDPVRPAED